MSIPVEPKKRGRPATGKRSAGLRIRLSPDCCRRLKPGRISSLIGPERSEAIRRLVEEALEGEAISQNSEGSD